MVPQEPNHRTSLITYQYTIFTPVLIDVETYLKGQRLQTQLTLFALGGIVGQDWVEVASPGGVYTFREGERVIVFLSGPHQAPSAGEYWSIAERYTIAADGQATNGLRRVPLDQLVGEIREALHR